MVPDEKDKRKQRILLTDKCREFCQENDRQSPNSADIIGKIFEGIEEKDLLTTIETIMQMERNLSEL